MRRFFNKRISWLIERWKSVRLKNLIFEELLENYFLGFMLLIFSCFLFWEILRLCIHQKYHRRHNLISMSWKKYENVTNTNQNVESANPSLPHFLTIKFPSISRKRTCLDDRYILTTSPTCLDLRMHSVRQL